MRMHCPGMLSRIFCLVFTLIRFGLSVLAVATLIVVGFGA